MASASGLSKSHRIVARDRAVQAAMLGLRNAGVVHYTQGAKRWDGINQKLNARKGQFPRYADCSAYATWCLWNGLYLPFNVRDTVNGAAWKAGYTGTMLNHGKPVQHLENVMRGDCVIYGQPGTTGKHTAIVVAVVKGVPYCVSHGSEAGPFYVRWNYRSDVQSIRRYI
jgi:hypothetical protein